MANIVIDVINNRSPDLDYVYSDLAFPLKKDQQVKDIEANYDLAAIKAAISNIFNWSKGERILLPEFGNLLYENLYDNMNKITEQNIRTSIQNMFRWEPRVSLDTIQIEKDIENQEYIVKVFYSIPSLKLNSDYTVSVRIE